ncbi:MAG: PQQ-binding-like beta-propeller repeat protein [Actinobacteria bacterium]|nr:PQQ-binding-like beta-propeller repeat protein [Actinomycetota bacterium]
MTSRTLMPVFALVVVCIGTAALASYFRLQTHNGPIARAPAFSASELGALPSEDWLTNGGSLSNDRYSPLAQINTTNVAQLKGVWEIHLGSATAAKYSGESQPIVYRGVMYLPTGDDEVYAISIRNGAVLWRWNPHINQKISTVCCGWESRGVALGDGKVYLGLLDGTVAALDQKTGKLVWRTSIGSWRHGYTITAAPLYYDGRVYSGISGGEYEIRGRETALDARTGRVLWRFYTVPGPGQVGNDTWPKNSNAWQRGGASIWNTPSVDPALNLIYFSTGNASPDFAGAERKGANLFTASIVAVDATTGKLKWYFQQVHHDIWDYDAPSPTLLFDLQVHGQMRHAVAEVGKTGWAYVLDRATGKPIFGIQERAVPQAASQQTYPTQPFPVGDATVQHAITPSEYKALVKATPNVKYVNGGKIFTPYTRGHPVFASPGTLGGTNWPPSSYNPGTHMMYVCGVDQAALFTGGKLNPYKPGAQELGSAFVPVGPASGTVTALDMTSNRIAWQRSLTDSCYSGSATTGGDLVFVGRDKGQLQALDAQTGKTLWSFQTGAGANNVPTIFKQGGTEYVAFYAGGSALGATPHGDNLWLFSLKGTLGPATHIGKAGGVLHAGEKPDVSKGGQVFAANCSVCHGALGQGGNGGPNLQTRPHAKIFARVVTQVTNGGGGMPPFKGTLSPAQIDDVAAFVNQKVAKPTR